MRPRWIAESVRRRLLGLAGGASRSAPDHGRRNS